MVQHSQQDHRVQPARDGDQDRRPTTKQPAPLRGFFNDLMLCGTLCGVEMGLHRAGIPHRGGGVAAALEFLGALGPAA